MSDTPRTDALARAIKCCSNTHSIQCVIYGACEFVDANDARTLERELSAKTAECERLAKDAERYRLFRTWWIAGWRVPQGDGMSLVTCTSAGFTCDTLDAAIDAELAKVQP